MSKKPASKSKSVVPVTTADNKEMMNSLSGMANTIINQPNPYGAQLSQTDTIFHNMRWYLISNQRQLLSEVYVEHGIVQTLVDQPVEDAFRPGFEIKTKHLSADEIEELEVYLEKHHVIRSIMQGTKWARLFGGGGVFVITEQNPSLPFDPAELEEGSKCEFRAFDQWEMYDTEINIQGEINLKTQEFYNYYGMRIHHSRVFPIKGKEGPSFIRPRLRGWGMSELERLVRSLNQYMKNQDVVFELLDEAKVDIYRIEGLNSALLDADGTTAVANRVQIANILKNYLNALTMDKNDEYEQKTMNFAGLGDMLTQIRQGVCADLKMPVTKVFGISAAGFNSGEDDIENYNSMIEGEVRAKVKYIMADLILVSCQLLFGTMPDDLKIIFKPLRILSAEQEENVKNAQFNRVMSAFQSGLIPAKEAKESINKGSLLPQEIAEDDAVVEPVAPAIEGDYTVASSTKKVDG